MMLRTDGGVAAERRAERLGLAGQEIGSEDWRRDSASGMGHGESGGGGDGGVGWRSAEKRRRAAAVGGFSGFKESLIMLYLKIVMQTGN